MRKHTVLPDSHRSLLSLLCFCANICTQVKHLLDDKLAIRNKAFFFNGSSKQSACNLGNKLRDVHPATLGHAEP